jgi:hypothetical protein
VCPIRGLDPSMNRRILRLGGKVRKTLIGRPTGVSDMTYRNEWREHTGAWKTNSGRSRRWRFQTATIPSGSLGAPGFLLYEATTSSGNWRQTLPS